jgi:hypothetical protein
LKPLTIAELQESAEEYRRLYHERKNKFMADTEALEEEFLSRELTLWDNCIHLLDFEKNYKDTDWRYVDDENVKVLVEGVDIIGFEKVYFSVKRKMEFIHDQISKMREPYIPTTKNDSVTNSTSSNAKIISPDESDKGNKTKPVPGGERFDIIHVAIACWCLEIDLKSKEGKKLIAKYTNSTPGDSLYKEKYQITESYFEIVRNKRVDNAKRRSIAEAKRLIKKLNNKVALANITDMQSTFEREYSQHHK